MMIYTLLLQTVKSTYRVHHGRMAGSATCLQHLRRVHDLYGLKPFHWVDLSQLIYPFPLLNGARGAICQLVTSNLWQKCAFTVCYHLYVDRVIGAAMVLV